MPDPMTDARAAEMRRRVLFKLELSWEEAGALLDESDQHICDLKSRDGLIDDLIALHDQLKAEVATLKGDLHGYREASAEHQDEMRSHHRGEYHD